MARKRTTSSAGHRARVASSGEKAVHAEAEELEFGGVPGTAVLTVVVPLVVLLVTHRDWLNFPYVSIGPFEVERVPDLFTLAYLRRVVTPLAFLAPISWWLLHVVLHIVLPADEVQGTRLKNGKTLTYRINGLSCVVVSVAGATAWHLAAVSGVVPALAGRDLSWLVESDGLEQIAFGTVVLCFLKALWLYSKSFAEDALLADNGDSGNAVYDFFMGRELNPRVSVLGTEVDLKFFNELRPGMSAWMLLATVPALVHAQELAAGEAEARPEVFLVWLLQCVYIVDSVAYETAILTTIDIIMDGFGFMLVAGDLAWVPFTFSLQGRFLVRGSRAPLGPAMWIVATAVGLVGYYIFRSSNLEKDIFKRNREDPRVAHLRTVPARAALKSTERALLAGGWWGTARHVNYLGDWLLGLGFCLLTGLESPVPYLYVVYFAVLLVHRERRDDQKCAKKYGKLWDEYRRVVPWRIIPNVY